MGAIFNVELVSATITTSPRAEHNGSTSLMAVLL
jgi:hypothetical protein